MRLLDRAYETPASQRPGLRPGGQGGADHRRPRGREGDREAARRRGAVVSPPRGRSRCRAETAAGPTATGGRRAAGPGGMAGRALELARRLRGARSPRRTTGSAARCSSSPRAVAAFAARRGAGRRERRPTPTPSRRSGAFAAVLARGPSVGGSRRPGRGHLGRRGLPAAAPRAPRPAAGTVRREAWSLPDSTRSRAATWSPWWARAAPRPTGARWRGRSPVT